MESKKKTKGAGKPAPKGDTTQKRRQSRRREKLNEIAKAAGFASWSAYRDWETGFLVTMFPSHEVFPSHDRCAQTGRKSVAEYKGKSALDCETDTSSRYESRSTF